ncbi:MAG: VTT domain-containing protein [Erysipelotrichaceae bacterium]
MFQWFEPYMQYLEPEFWFSIAEAFKGLGPLAPIFLAFIESVIPALPLLVIITFNTSVYGPVLGFVYSWIGTTLGAIIMFSFYRFVFRRFLLKAFGHYPKVQKAMQWVSKQPASTLFIITAIPFTPSSAINLAYGLSDFSKRDFIKTTILAKLIMVLSMTLFGTTFKKAFDNPFYILVAVALLILLMYIANVIKKRNHLDELE